MSVSAFSDVVRARVMARSGGFCEVRVNGCWDEGSQYHHRRPRGMGGSRSSVSGGAANCLFVCLSCHNALETAERAEARDRGWIVRQGADPRQVPVYRYRRWVLLNDEGGITPVEAQSWTTQ